jgi:hypothetical protein
MAEVKLDFTGDSRAAQAELDKLTRKIAGLTEQMRKMRDDGSRGAKEQASSFDKMGSSLATVAMRYVSVGAAAAAITAELRDQMQLQRELARFQETAAGSQIKLLRNLGVVSAQERAKVLAEITEISRRTGVTEQNLFLAASNAVSAKGGLSNLQALQSVEMAARVAPEDVGELTGVAGGLLDTSSLTGTADARRNLAFMVALQEQSRVTNIRGIATQTVPGAIGVKGFGGTSEEAAALVATLSNAMKDQGGEKSKTAAIALAQQLEAQLPAEDTFAFDAKGRRKMAAPGTGLASTEERIRRLQEDGELRERFLATATLDMKEAIVPMRDLLTKGSPTSQLFQQNIAKLNAGTPPEKADELIAGIQGIPVQQLADLQRRSVAGPQRAMLANIPGGAQGAAYGAVDTALEQSGHGWMSRSFERFLMSLRPALTGKTPAEVGIERLESLQYARLEETEEGRAQLKVLREQLEVLKGLQALSQGKKNVDAHVE